MFGTVCAHGFSHIVPLNQAHLNYFITTDHIATLPAAALVFECSENKRNTTDVKSVVKCRGNAGSNGFLGDN